jgi:hypothetical protein
MKIHLFTVLLIVTLSSPLDAEVAVVDIYKIIDQKSNSTLRHKVFKQDRLSKMKPEAAPFTWLHEALSEIEKFDEMQVKLVNMVDNLNPAGNGCLSYNDGVLLVQIPDSEAKDGNGLDYKWFSLVWGVEYYKKQKEIQKLMESYRNKQMTKKELVENLSRIRVQVITKVRKFYDEIWTPWCVEVGAIPNSPLTWLKHVEVNNPDTILQNLTKAGDVKRIEEWVDELIPSGQ